jgi:hypothetical protein
MGDQRALDAIGRIERALARIEVSARRPPPPTTDAAELERLRGAHQALRGRIEGAIGQLDRLLDGGER